MTESDPTQPPAPEANPDPTDSGATNPGTAASGPGTSTGTGDGSVGTALFGKHLATKAPMTTAWLTGIAILAIAMTILLPLVLILMRPEDTVLRYINDDAYARGTITLLFSLGTIGVAMIVTITGVWRVLAGQDASAKARFDRGKDVLAILVGILGTIIGFYFANSQDDDAGSAIAIAGPEVEAAPSGEGLTLSLALAGGTPPYLYSLTFDPPVEGDWENLTTESGLIRQDLGNASTVGKNGSLGVTIDVRDDRNVRFEHEASLKLPSSPAPASPTPDSSPAASPPQTPPS